MAGRGSDSEGGATRPASSESTGGGFTFERKAAARYLSAMLAGASRPELGDRLRSRKPRRVRRGAPRL